METKMSPRELACLLEKLQQAGLTASDFGKLHHFSQKNHPTSLAGAISYFKNYATLQGNNISLAERCKYVADRVQSDGRHPSSLIDEALKHVPFDNC